MTDKIQEQISALVDDEIHRTELSTVVVELSKNRESAELWQRYNLISDSLHNNLPDAIAPDLAERVQQALKDEPTILAPRRKRIPARAIPALKQVGGMAVAASVAVVLVITLQQDQQSDSSVGQQVVQQQSTPLPSAVSTLVADVKQPPVQLLQPAAISRPVLVADIEPEPVWPVAVTPQAFDPRFESYLINHNEYAITTGMLPYTRLVGHAVGTAQPVNGE